MIISLFMEETPVCCGRMIVGRTAAAGAHACRRRGKACEHQPEAQDDDHGRKPNS
jgi:hypothetical protein